VFPKPWLWGSSFVLVAASPTLHFSPLLSLELSAHFELREKQFQFRAIYGVAHIYFEAIPLERFDKEICVFLDGTSNMICHSSSSVCPFIDETQRNQLIFKLEFFVSYDFCLN
jgi:hypothetical protein